MKSGRSRVQVSSTPLFLFILLRMYYVYIIQTETNGSYYVGYTRNISERLKRHNEGRSTYTKSKENWKLVYVEEYKTSAEARAREREIKGKKSKKYIEHLVRTSPAKGGGRSRVQVSSAPLRTADRLTPISCVSYLSGGSRPSQAWP